MSALGHYIDDVLYPCIYHFGEYHQRHGEADEKEAYLIHFEDKSEQEDYDRQCQMYPHVSLSQGIFDTVKGVPE